MITSKLSSSQSLTQLNAQSWGSLSSVPPALPVTSAPRSWPSPFARRSHLLAIIKSALDVLEDAEVDGDIGPAMHTN